MEKRIKVACECEGTGFIAVADNGGDGIEHVESGQHHPELGLMDMTECKCPLPKDKTKITENLWKVGESKYKWNVPGSLKDYSYNCEECGKEQHFMPL